MKKLRIYALTILVYFAISLIHADIGHLYTGNQMSSSLIECVTQDKYGFIWVGTEYGLNKFDGYHFTSYLSDPNDSTSLVGNEVVRLLSDSQGRLWVGTHTGIARFDYELNKFQRYTFPITEIPRVNALTDCANGDILYGMPRTIPQEEALRDNGLELDAVLSLEISDEEIINRMSGRRICPNCGASFHTVSHAPKKEGICDNCGEKLITRPDDAPETVRARLDVYHEQTEPLKQFYAQMGKLRPVENAGSIEAVSQAVFKALGIGE